MKYLFGIILLIVLSLVSFNAFGCNPRVFNQVNCAPYYPPQTIIIEVPVQYGRHYPQVRHGYPQVGVGAGYGYGVGQSRYSRFSISGNLGIGTGSNRYYNQGNRGAAGVGFHYETGKSEVR